MEIRKKIVPILIVLTVITGGIAINITAVHADNVYATRNLLRQNPDNFVFPGNIHPGWNILPRQMPQWHGSIGNVRNGAYFTIKNVYFGADDDMDLQAQILLSDVPSTYSNGYKIYIQLNSLDLTAIEEKSVATVFVPGNFTGRRTFYSDQSISAKGFHDVIFIFYNKDETDTGRSLGNIDGITFRQSDLDNKPIHDSTKKNPLETIDAYSNILVDDKNNFVFPYKLYPGGIVPQQADRQSGRITNIMNGGYFTIKNVDFGNEFTGAIPEISLLYIPTTYAKGYKIYIQLDTLDLVSLEEKAVAVISVPGNYSGNGTFTTNDVVNVKGVRNVIFIFYNDEETDISKQLGTVESISFKKTTATINPDNTPEPTATRRPYELSTYTVMSKPSSTGGKLPLTGDLNVVPMMIMMTVIAGVVLYGFWLRRKI